MFANDELRRQQEAQHDHDALHRFENEGGTVDREVRPPTMAELCDFFENTNEGEVQVEERRSPKPDAAGSTPATLAISEPAFIGVDYGSQPGYAVGPDGELLEADLPESYGLGILPEPGQSVSSRIAALALTDDEAASVVAIGETPAQEAERLAAELDSDPLSRAYRSLQMARTGKERRSAASRVRRATRHQLARKMRSLDDHFQSNPDLARHIAAQVVRASMSPHAKSE